MKTVAFLFSLLVFTVTAGWKLDDAHERFAAGEYRLAAQMYDWVEQSGSPANGRFFFNQGNAHYLARNLPEAIFAYRRAEYYWPNDRRLQANLAAARAEVLESPGHPQRWGPPWLPRLARTWQARSILILAAVGWVILFRVLWNGSRAQVVFGAALLTLAGLWAAAIHLQENHDAKHPFAVVRVNGVLLRKGNGGTYPPVTVNEVPYDLKRGVEAKVLLAKPNGWLRVELANGVVGWLPREAVLLERDLDAPS